MLSKRALITNFHVLKLFLHINTLFDNGNVYEGVGRFMESNTVLKAIPSLFFFCCALDRSVHW